MEKSGTTPEAFKVLLVSLCMFFAAVFSAGCSASGKKLKDPNGRLIIPWWYKVNFVLHYPDGRTYEGQCTWPPGFDRVLQFDIEARSSYLGPPKVIRSVQEIYGTRALQFVPNGYGTMTYPDGSRKKGLWKNGTFLGPQKGKSKKAASFKGSPTQLNASSSAFPILRNAFRCRTFTSTSFSPTTAAVSRVESCSKCLRIRISLSTSLIRITTL